MIDFRSTRTVTYTSPASGADERRLEEIAAIDALGLEATKEELARRDELAQQIAPAEQVSITLATITAYQFGRYETYRRQVGAWLAEQLGMPATEAAETDEGRRLFLLGLRWARMRAALVTMGRRAASRIDGEGSAWAEIKPPATWDSPASYLAEVPAELAAALADAAEAVNPGLFAVNMSETAKKNGGISVE